MSLAVGVIAVLLLALGGVVGPPGKASAAPLKQAPPVPVSALDGLLPGPDAVAAALGFPSASVAGSWDQMGSASGDYPACIVVTEVLTPPAYDGSGYTAVRGQVLYSPAGAVNLGLDSRMVIQGVVAFPQAQAASDFYTKTATTWKNCAGSRNVPSAFDPMAIGQVADSGGILSTSTTAEGGPGNTENCQRGLSARNNIVIDFKVCGEGGTDPIPASVVPALVGLITQRIDAAA